MAQGGIGACGQDWLKLDCYIYRVAYIPDLIVFLDYKKVHFSLLSYRLWKMQFLETCVYIGEDIKTQLLAELKAPHVVLWLSLLIKFILKLL